MGAGNNSVVTGGALKGTPSQPVGASQVVGAVADLIDSANTQVKNAAANVKDAAVFAKSIKVPSITFSTVDTPFGRLVSGITVLETSPFQAVHDELEAASGDLSAMAAKLHDASASLHTLDGAVKRRHQPCAAGRVHEAVRPKAPGVRAVSKTARVLKY